MWVIGHSRSLKLVQFESLSAVSYSPSIVTVAVSVAVSEIIIIIIIIITKTMFMVLSSWQSHCESSPGSSDECRMAPSGC